MSIKLRDYQEKLMNDMVAELQEKDEVVIAASPSSGKTIVTMKFIQDNPTKKFLILTHGTNVLKSMWESELSTNSIEASDVPSERNVCYGLPQGHRQFKKLNGLDYLVVDEAHEFTFAKTVQNLIKELKPKKIIYLTGTPSKFIAKGYKPLIVAGIDLIQRNMISDLYVSMVSTNAKIDDDSFNPDGDLKESQNKYIEKTVEEDLDNLLEAMHQRLCEGVFKNKPEARKLVRWAPTLGALQKTMIACKSIKQAEKVHAYFVKKKISSVLSHSEADKLSENIERFSKEPEIRVLVVVARGILGFNMPNLVNVVDITCSQNIDRIYQLYARVMRKNDKEPNKYFFKFATEERMLISRFYMDGALMLLRPEFISKYNGKNLKEMKIPDFRKIGEKRERTDSKPDENKCKKNRLNVDKELYDTVMAGAMLIDIYNKIGQSSNEYAYVSFGKILEKLSGNKFLRTFKVETIEQLRYLEKYGVLPEECYIERS